MMVRAPGKVVLTGAYAVLEGAPAWVAAVDRYVVADTARSPEFVTPEVAESLREIAGASAPWFDASALRDPQVDRKLGLGSSAAILVASLAALALAAEPDQREQPLAAAVFARALHAHRVAQGGGSGVDVAASTFGGVLRFQRAAPDAPPFVSPRALPSALVIAVWSSQRSASTATMLAAVARLRDAGDGRYRALVARLRAAAEACDHATTAEGWLAIFREQLAALRALGQAAAIPVVTPEMEAFHRAVSDLGAVVLPSGAGGGDVILVASNRPVDPEVEHRGRALGLSPLGLSLGARGVHQVSPPSPTGPSPSPSPRNHDR